MRNTVAFEELPSAISSKYLREYAEWHCDIDKYLMIASFNIRRISIDNTRGQG